jgi:hypothetical protein
MSSIHKRCLMWCQTLLSSCFLLVDTAEAIYITGDI